MIVLTQDLRGSIVDHAREGAPLEVCGVLGGTHGEDESRVERAYRTPNVAPSPQVTYEIDPEALFEAIETLQAAGCEVAGFYHSHPNGPRRPSPTDEAQATWEGHSYVIVEPGDDPFLGSWRWTGETFEEEALENE